MEQIQNAAEPYQVQIGLKDRERLEEVYDVIETSVYYGGEKYPRFWKFTTADGLASYFAYDKVLFIIAFREE